MDFLFIDAVYDGKVALSKRVIETLKKLKPRKLALYASVQYASKLDTIIKQLNKAGIKTITSRPARTDSDYQILGCDVFSSNIKLGKLGKGIDAFFYVGDGRFHPLALLLYQKNKPVKELKPVIVYNPLAKKIDVLGINDVSRILKKYRASLIKFIASDVIGIVISLKPGQQYYKQALELEKKYPNKSFYYFIADTISPESFENFPFIECWVNTACPRLAFDDAVNTNKFFINLTDAIEAEKLLSHGNLFKQRF